MRKDIAFKTEDGVTLRGWLYLPDRPTGSAPGGLVLVEGFEPPLNRF